MELPQRHTSPDGDLTLLAVRTGDDTTLGFEGFPWHTHGSLLADDYARHDEADLAPDQAAQRFVDDIRSDRAVIVTAYLKGRPVDTWASLRPDLKIEYWAEHDEITGRLWSR